ncbi:MAG: hypothetical protein EBY09_06345, partial [Verrucomicrobia bacterium]|nr:hypothetical protein [Verrucomicrobiota bacterium]
GYVVSEGVTNAVLTVTRSGAITNQLSVDYATVAGGTATPFVHYTPVNGTLTFTNGVTNRSFLIPIVDDQVAQADRTVNVSLSNLIGLGFLGTFTTATVTIVDNDVGLQFATNNFSVQEAGPNATITVTRTGATNSTVTVNYATSDGSAVAGRDYLSQIGTLSFGPNVTSRAFSITILNNSIVEPDKTVNLSLSLPTGGAFIQSPASATLTIVNDDTAVQFMQATYSIAENLTNALITVQRIGVTNTAFTVDFGTADGTAIAGVKYVTTNGTLSFPAGVTSNSFRVQVMDDALPLGDQTVNLSLANLVGGAVLGPQATAVLNILDNEVTVQFGSATYSVLEDQTNALINVTRIGSGGGTVTVDYAVTAGSAVAGTDFVSSSNTLSFSPGVTNLTFAVSVIDNILLESNRTVSLTLSNPSGSATLGAPSAAVLRIVDNDRLGSQDSLFFTATGADGDVNAVAVYTNVASPHFGKAIIAGDFHKVNGAPVERVARLNIDGTIDPTFNVGTGPNNVVYAVAIDSSDRILVGGGFSMVAGLPRNNFTRLNADGSQDLTYNATGAGADAAVLALKLQPDGKAVIGGAFLNVNGAARSRIARLNADGSLDAGYNPGGADNLIYALAVDANTNVLAAGLFTTFSGTARSQLARVTLAGALDPVFVPGLNSGAQVYALSVQPDGKILVGGSFTISVFGRTNLVRLSGFDGSLDPLFSATALPNSAVRALALETSGKILLAGDFTAINGTSRGGVARLNSNGTLDAAYDTGLGANGSIFAIGAQPDGKAIIGGRFSMVDGIARGNVDRLNGDHGVVQFVSATASVLERGTNVTLSVARLNGASGGLTVDYGTTNGTALAGVRYVATNGTLTFGPGVTNQDIVVGILNDKLVQGDGTFTVGLQNVVAGSLGAQTTTTVTIVDDDSTLQFSVAVTNVFENANSLVLTVTRVGVIDTTVTVPFNSVNGTALHGSDYLGVTNTLTFGTNVASQNITVPILNDQIQEPSETFTVNLGLPGGEASLGANTSVVVTILDNDSTLFLATNAITVFENATNAVLVVSRTGYTNNAVTVDYFTADGTALAGSDYLATNGTLNFGTGVVSLTISVPLVNNQVQEPTETFSLSLTNVTGEASLGAVTNATITVLDNDSTLQLTSTAQTVTESAGSVTFTVVRTGFLNNTVTVPFSTVDGTAVAGSDYVQTTNVLTFGTNVSSQNIIIPILNDTVVESTETFTLQLYPPGGEASLGGNSSATITILDDDSSVSFTAPTVAVAESAGGVTLTVARTGTLNSTVSVQFATANGSALAGSDYVATNGTLTFGTNVSSQTIVVPILNDTVVEPDETFSVVLSVPAGELSLGANSTVIVTILNDDSTLQFTANNYSVIERAGSVVLTVSRIGASNSVVTVPYLSVNVTAFAGADYTAVAGSLTFGSNVTSQDIVVPILNDRLKEGDETFTVRLGTPTGEASLGAQSTTTVTIVDDDSVLQFATTTASVLESGGFINLTVSRVGVIDTTVTVPFTFADASATNGVDYRGTNGILTFGTNVAAQSITVGIINNLIVQSNRTFTVTLGAGVGGEAALGANRIVTVTIVDDDSVLQFPFTSLNVAESAGSLSVTVQRVGATNVPVYVDLATADGLTRTATANVDYSSVTTNLFFAIGQTTVSVPIAIVNDTIEEGTENFRVLLSNPTGEATLGSQSNLTVSIIDDDFRTLINAGVTLLAESFSPTNRAVDPLETVTMSFALRNAGNVNGSNITATLLPTGGV